MLSQLEAWRSTPISGRAIVDQRAPPAPVVGWPGRAHPSGGRGPWRPLDLGAPDPLGITARALLATSKTVAGKTAVIDAQESSKPAVALPATLSRGARQGLNLALASPRVTLVAVLQSIEIGQRLPLGADLR